MKKFYLLLCFCLLCGFIYPQSTCANAPTITSGGCINNQNFPGSVNMTGLCVGGSNPALYIKFVAGSCSQFTITPSANFGTIGSQILTSACVGVANSLQCHDNVISGVPFVADCHDNNGNYLLTPGTTYVLRLWGAVGTSTFNICYDGNVTEAASNECSGALTLGGTPTQFFNGGDCAFTGAVTDPITSDPVASGLCAGSLENTQWVKFQPVSGVSSFQIIGTNINCTGGGCGFQFGIFSGTCGSLVSEGCFGNKVCSGGQSTAGPTNVNANDGFSVTWNSTSATSFSMTITKTGGGLFNGTEVFYLVMDGNADADCQYTLQGVNLQLLPIELISFESLSIDKTIKLIWKTATEQNSSHFDILRSKDAINFEKIGTVQAKGNSLEVTDYEFYDSDLQNNIYYYLLKCFDEDGTSRYSSIISALIDWKEFPPTYYNLNGVEVDFDSCSPGLYIKREGLKFSRVVKSN